jgi:hypothetical protein
LLIPPTHSELAGCCSLAIVGMQNFNLSAHVASYLKHTFTPHKRLHGVEMTKAISAYVEY